MTEVKIKRRRIPQPELIDDGMTVQNRKKGVPRYDLQNSPNGRRPVRKSDIEDFALDLIDRGDRHICDWRDDLRNSIWLYQIAGECANLGSQRPTWDDVKPPLNGNWDYKNKGKADLSKKVIHDPKITWPDMHEFTKRPPTDQAVFITQAGVEMGGYVKFFITPMREGCLYLASFHGLNKNGCGK